MKYTKEKRLDIERRIYDGELTRYEAAKEYEISEQTVRNYMRLYRDVNHLPPRKGAQHICGLAKTRSVPAPTGLEELQSMTKEELIDALVMAKITEARLKKAIWWKELVCTRSSFLSAGRVPSSDGAFRSISRSSTLRKNRHPRPYGVRCERYDHLLCEGHILRAHTIHGSVE